MQRRTDDEGAIIHWAGRQRLHPVREGQDGPIGFSAHGQDETGKRRIGWGEFMRVRRREDRLLVYDDQSGSWELPQR